LKDISAAGCCKPAATSLSDAAAPRSELAAAGLVIKSPNGDVTLKKPRRGAWITGCAQFSSARCFPKRCCSQIVTTTRTGSGNLLANKENRANIPPKRNRKDPICFSPYLYRTRNLIERLFNKIKQRRRVTTRYNKLAFVKLASIRVLAVRL
jgi:transposase